MSSETLTAAESSGGPEPAAGFEGDQRDETLGGVVRGYVDKVRGGNLGALPAVLGIVVLGAPVHGPPAGHLPHPAQPDQPAAAGRPHHPAGDGAGVRAPARRDRPVRRRGQRRVRRRPRQAAGRDGIPVVGRRAGGDRHRRGDRSVHRQPGGDHRHPVVRGHPGAVPGLAGRDAAADRPGRHGARPGPCRQRFQQLDDAGVAGLGPGRRSSCCSTRPCSSTRGDASGRRD